MNRGEAIKNHLEVLRKYGNHEVRTKPNKHMTIIEEIRAIQTACENVIKLINEPTILEQKQDEDIEKIGADEVKAMKISDAQDMLEEMRNADERYEHGYPERA